MKMSYPGEEGRFMIFQKASVLDDYSSVLFEPCENLWGPKR